MQQPQLPTREATEAGFSIHQDLWHEAWVAGTSAVRSRKKQIVDYSIQKRVQQLLEDYGPRSGRPLTLRVYGTLMKGFCVINNERAKVLHADCERVVLLFSEQPSGEESKLPAAKRQRVDAMSLDLDLSKVQESEAFDWTQATMLDETALLPLLQLQDDSHAANVSLSTALVPLPQVSQSSLLDQVPLLDEAFPAIADWADANRANNALALETPAAAAARATAPRALPKQVATDGEPHPMLAGDQSAMEADDMELAMQLKPEGCDVQPRRRFLRGLPRTPVPGYVFGFDERPSLAQQVWNDWQQDDGPISINKRSPADFATAWIDPVGPNHLGPLRLFLDPPSEVLFPPNFIPVSIVPTAVGQLPRLPLQAAPMPIDGGFQAGITTDEEFPMVAVAPAQEACSAVATDPFRPYDTKDVPPLACVGASQQRLAGLLGGPPALQEQADDESGVAYDAHTAKVGALMKRFLQQGETEAREVTLDDLVPTASSDRATAARAFHALLTLATAGDFAVQQAMPYGPIAINAASIVKSD